MPFPKEATDTIQVRHAIKLLLVEDNPADVSMIRRLLSKSRMLEFGITDTDFLNSALTLLRYPRDGQFDIIFLDLNLQDSRGIDTVMAMHREVPDIPIVVLSGQEDIKIADMAVQCGASDFVVKKDPGLYTERDIVDEMERKAWFSIRRYQQQITSKALTRVSLEKAGALDADPAIVHMVREHIHVLEEGINDFRTYLKLHYPEAWDALSAVYEDKLLRPIQDIRLTLKMEERTNATRLPRGRKRSQDLQAMEDVAEVTKRQSSDPVLPSSTLEETERQLLEALNINPFGFEPADDFELIDDE